MAQLVPAPALPSEGRLVVASGPVALEVDPALGGRVVRYAHDGVDILAGPTFHEQYWGSTFWLSPEGPWSSSSPSAHDSGPYEVLSGDRLPLVMKTARPSVVGDNSIEVTKSFDVDPADGAIIVTYTVANVGRLPVELAPWEVTRLPGGQLSFFPYGSIEKATDGIRLEINDGVAWFDHREHVDEGGQKLWADGREGWSAHVSGDLLHVKQFGDLTVAEAANGETDVEIYSSDRADNPRAYIELESQGPVVVLAPGARTSWSVRWYLVPIPPTVSRSVGSSGLAQLARDTIR